MMLEFADFFFEGKSLPAPLAKPAPVSAKPKPAVPKSKTAPAKPAPTAKPATPPPKTKTPPALLLPAAKNDKKNDDQTAREALEKLREQVDPKQINWGRAGYDFGEGFKGPKGDRR